MVYLYLQRKNMQYVLRNTVFHNKNVGIFEMCN